MLDRYTAFSVAGGALMGAKGYSPVAALGVALAVDIWENYHRPGQPLERRAAGFGVTMAAWWLTRQAVR